MCEFCDFKNKNDGKRFLDTRGRESYLLIRKFMGKFLLLYGAADAQNNDAIINYCPLCGRKLSEVSKE